VRRTLTLVDAFRDMGVIPRLFLSNKDGASLVRDHGYEFQVGLPDSFSDDILLIDTCSHTADFVSDLCAKARISCVIDDLGEQPVKCDYIINPNLYASDVDYSAYQTKQVFYGPAHSLLANEFFTSAAPEQDRSGIVVSFGGTDDGSLAATVAELIITGTSEPVYVPIPDYMEISDKLTALVSRTPQVQAIVAPDMAALLGHARVYVGAAGATVLEALAAGCRVCVAATQKDQMQNVAYLPSVGIPAVTLFHADAIAAMVQQVLLADQQSIVFNAEASSDIAATALQAYHQAA
jgi:spore coat polysaccharide biosynthesis predicted glycosyltransferase SpsG